ncbi:AAA family ATPase [Caldimonas sp.]|uniref:AAA family ATPase n=1 Tax=Caldimonas sp. TaxID=2838790 RepID=UPI00307DA123
MTAPDARPVLARPVLFVLAGVNGAGKSSIGGHLLTRQGLTWFNPDRYARELVAAGLATADEASGLAWAEGLRRLDDALARGRHHAFETTLGGTTIAQRLREATRTHDVLMWFCGLDSPERHRARVAARVRAGGHDIPEERIRQRYPRALANLIVLMPHLAHLQVYDNSTEAAPGAPIPDPRLLLELRRGQLTHPRPDDLETLRATPAWAHPLLEAALSLPAPAPAPATATR